MPGFSVHGIFQARILEGGLPFPSPGDPPDPGIRPMSLASQVDFLPLSHQDFPKRKYSHTNVEEPPSLTWK